MPENNIKNHRHDNDLRSRAAMGMLIAICIMALALRIGDLFVPGHFAQPDEGFSITAAQKPTVQELTRFVARDAHPPLYFVVLRYWLKIIPGGLFSAKILSVLFNVANIVLSYFLARIWTSRKTAILAAFILAVSPWNIYWAHLARNHQMLPAFFTLSSLLLFRWLKSPRERFPWGYALATIVMVHINYLSFFIVGAQVLIAITDCRRRLQRLALFFPAILLAACSYIPLMDMLIYQLLQGPMNATHFQHQVSPGLLFYHFLFYNILTTDLGVLWYPPPSHWLSILFGGLIIAGGFIGGVKKLRNISFYILLLVPPASSVIFAKIGQTTMAERYLAYSIGPFAILFASGMMQFYRYSKKPFSRITDNAD